MWKRQTARKTIGVDGRKDALRLDRPNGGGSQVLSMKAIGGAADKGKGDVWN